MALIPLRRLAHCGGGSAQFLRPHVISLIRRRYSALSPAAPAATLAISSWPARRICCAVSSMRALDGRHDCTLAVFAARARRRREAAARRAAGICDRYSARNSGDTLLIDGVGQHHLFGLGGRDQHTSAISSKRTRTEKGTANRAVRIFRCADGHAPAPSAGNLGTVAGCLPFYGYCG